MRRFLIACVVLALATSLGWGQEEQPEWNTGADLVEKISRQEDAPPLPTKHHEHLASLAGTWTGKVRIWMGPEPTDSRSFAISEMVLADNYLKTEYKGEFMGQTMLGRMFVSQS